jgi:PAS domain S-box-containing protein
MKQLTNDELKTSTPLGIFELLESKNKWKKYNFLVHNNEICQTETKVNLQFINVINSFPFENSIDLKVIDFDSITGKKNSFAVYFSKNEKIILRSDTLEAKNDFTKKIGTSVEKSNFESIFETLNEAIVCSDHEGIIKYVNPSALKMFGFESSSGLVGKNVAILMDPKFELVHHDYMKKYEETHNKKLIGVPRKVKGRNKNGEELNLEVSLGESSNESYKFVASFIFQEKEDHRSQNEIQEFQTQISTSLDSIVEKYEEEIGDIYKEYKLKLIAKMKSHQALKLELESLYGKFHRVQNERKALQNEKNMYILDLNSNFMKLLTDEKGYKKYLQFCEFTECGEMLKFWRQVENFKLNPNRLKAKEIYDNFIAENSEHELNTNEEQKENIKVWLDHPIETMFDPLQKEMLLLLAMDSYRKFCKTETGKAFILSIEN